MTTVERLRAATDPKRGLSIAPELTALLEAAEEAEKALVHVMRSDIPCSFNGHDDPCQSDRALAKLRSLGFGGKV